MGKADPQIALHHPGEPDEVAREIVLIEAQILSEHFGIVITVIDTKSGSMTDFGEGIGSSQRMILVYDGIHYDALCKDEGENRYLFKSF